MPYPLKHLLPTVMKTSLRLTVDFAIQAGSLVEAAQPLIAVRDNGIEHLAKALNRHERVHIDMAEALQQNFEDTANRLTSV